MINDMAEMKSNRAVLCLKNSEGLGHAVPVVLLNVRMMGKNTVLIIVKNQITFLVSIKIYNKFPVRDHMCINV
jgi:hypothetical protein